MTELHARGRWAPGFVTALSDGRGHEVRVDLTAEEGGTDAGTSALELSVLSLAGCITTIFALVARRRRLAFSGLEVELDASRPKGTPTITAVRGTVDVVAAASEEDVATVLRITLRTCPVGVLFEKAGIPVEVRLRLRPPGAPPPEPS